jgi:hypothetical protein
MLQINLTHVGFEVVAAVIVKSCSFWKSGDILEGYVAPSLGSKSKPSKKPA